MISNKTKLKTKEYYDTCQVYYDIFYGNKKLLAMHYGFWNKDTKNLKQSLINQYEFLQKVLAPKKGELILDAGCGVGGASIWLAEKSEAKFEGITISPIQVKKANINLKKRKLEKKVKFKLMDFFELKYKPEFFDKIFAIESFDCSFNDPKELSDKFYKVLKKKGKLIIFDGFMTINNVSNSDMKTLKKWGKYWGQFGIASVEKLKLALKKSGFRNIKIIDKTPDIAKTVMYIYRWSIFGVPILKILRFFRLVSEYSLENGLGCNYQKKMYDKGIFEYKIIIAEK